MSDELSWFFLKNILIGPPLRVLSRPKAEGTHHVPVEGPAIIASNHLAVCDSFFMPMMISRRVTFLAKSDYFTQPGFVGFLKKKFFEFAGQVPVDRSSGQAAESALIAARKVLGSGGLLGIYPEGSRSPDGRLHRGKTGAARIALDTGAPIVPVAMFGTRETNPPGTVVPRPGPVRVVFGEPLNPADYADSAGDRAVERAFTDDLMKALQQLSGQEYVDRYSADVKAEIAAQEADEMR